MTAPYPAADVTVAYGGRRWSVGAPYVPPQWHSYVDLARLFGAITPVGVGVTHVDLAKMFGTVTPSTPSLIPQDGTYVPSKTNVGVFGTYGGLPAGTVLTENHSVTVAYAGSSDPNNPVVVSNTRFHGAVSVTSGYILFLNCDFYFLPTAATINKRVVTITSTTVGLAHFVNCDIHADYSDPDNQPNGNTVAIVCTNTLLERCRIYETADGVNPTKQNVTVRSCWIGDQLYISPDPLRQASGSLPPYYCDHADCVQIADGSNYTVEYCTLDAFNSLRVGQGMVLDNGQTGSCMRYTGVIFSDGRTNSWCNSSCQFNLKAGMRNIVFRYNHFAGGNSQMNVAGTCDGPTLQLIGNVYNRETVYNRNNLLVPAAMKNGNVTWSGETYDDGSALGPRN